MTRYVLTRLLILPGTLLVVSFLSFGIVNASPGSVAASLADPNDPASIPRIEHELGLDRPFLVQYVDWLGSALRGDLGSSFINQRAVSAEFASRIGITLEIAVVAVLFALVVGVGLAMLAARYRGTRLDKTIMAATTLGVSIPSFMVATLLVLFFSLYVPSYPIISFTPVSEGLLENLRSVLIPSFAMSLPAAATFCRYVRAASEDILRESDYVRTAKAKGAGRTRILLSHVLPNAVVPLATVAGLQFGYLIGGSVLIETIFALPGVGSRLMQAITERDFPVVQAGVLLLALVFVLVTFLVDLLYPLLDPRIRVLRSAA